MKRVNEMVGILTEPERRVLYDQSLSAGALVVNPPRWTRYAEWVRNNRGWSGVSLASVILLTSAVFIPAKNPLPMAKRQEPSSRARSEPALKPIPAAASPKRRSREEVPERATVLPSVDHPQAHEIAALPDAPSPPALNLESRPETPAPLVRAPSVPPAGPTLAGQWVYAPDPGDSRASRLFPADYVELNILIDRGELRGAYRSRYKVADRAASPVVNFTFEGPAGATSFPWRNDSGASGEITLQMHSGDALRVSWFATAMGSTLSLGSGAATLYRFR